MCNTYALALLFKQKVIVTVGWFDDLGNNLDNWIRTTKKLKIYLIDDTLANFKVHSGSATVSDPKLCIMWIRESYCIGLRHGVNPFSTRSRRYYKFLIMGR